jgi:selenocysteine-specific elongation factor
VTVVVGTAGHIDHGKTTLLRALTGIDADRLPEEQRRGMTLDVGYAHCVLPNGRMLDFVDVPGHDRLVGNMLVGAGEIDAALLVVAADDGPRAQTIEHLSLLDAYGIVDGLAVVTKADLVPAERLEEVEDALAGMLASTGLAGVRIIEVSARTGLGLEALVEALSALEDRASRKLRTRAAPRLAIDRVFSVRGRGTVVTGSLRGGGLAAGNGVRILPGEGSARVREVQVHGRAVADAAAVGRTALNLSGVAAPDLRRGQVIGVGPGLEVSDRMLVALRPPAPLGTEPAPWPPREGLRVRLHLGTDQVGARVGIAGREGAELVGGRWAAILRLDAPVATAVGDRFVLRRPSPGELVAGGIVLDPLPATGVARRRTTPLRLRALDAAVVDGDGTQVIDALVELHGALEPERLSAIRAVLRAPGDGPIEAEPVRLAPDVAAELGAAARSLVAEQAARKPDEQGVPIAEVRLELKRRLGRSTGVRERSAADAVDRLLAGLAAAGRLGRDGERLRDASTPAGPSPGLLAAMERLERLLSTPAPPALGDAAREADCPAPGVRALETSGRIVRLEADLAWAAPTYQRLAAQALAMARRGPLSPAAFRDATGTSRRYVLAILEDLDRRGILQRGPDGHRPGPRAPATPPVDASAR